MRRKLGEHVMVDEAARDAASGVIVGARGRGQVVRVREAEHVVVPDDDAVAVKELALDEQQLAVDVRGGKVARVDGTQRHARLDVAEDAVAPLHLEATEHDARFRGVRCGGRRRCRWWRR